MNASPARAGVSLDQTRRQLDVLLQERRPRLGVGEPDRRLDRGTRDLRAIERGAIEQRRRVPCQAFAELDEMLERDLIGDRLESFAIAPHEPWREDERPRHRFVELFDEVPLAPLARFHEQPRGGELPHVVVDPLPRLPSRRAGSQPNPGCAARRARATASDG